jgi:alpha-tubulin suppressor-like RCC1 family protein
LTGFPENIIEIACGQSHTLLLTEGGQVFSFGRNAYGQLGHGEDEPVCPNKSSFSLICCVSKVTSYFIVNSIPS